MTSQSTPDINGPTTAAKDSAVKPDGLPERHEAQSADMREQLDQDPEDHINLTDQPGHAVDRRLQEPTGPDESEGG